MTQITLKEIQSTPLENYLSWQKTKQLQVSQFQKL